MRTYGGRLARWPAIPKPLRRYNQFAALDDPAYLSRSQMINPGYEESIGSDFISGGRLLG